MCHWSDSPQFFNICKNVCLVLQDNTHRGTGTDLQKFLGYVHRRNTRQNSRAYSVNKLQVSGVIKYLFFSMIVHL